MTALVRLRTSRQDDVVAGAPVARRRVALVVMPVFWPEYPSLGVSTLAVALRDRGHHVDVLYLNVEAAAAIGLRDYAPISQENSWVRNVGEWLLAHPSIAPGAADDRTMRAFLARETEYSAPFPDLDFERLRRAFDGLLDGWTDRILRAGYDVVGFSVMFQQLNASLRLARAIKERSPTTRVVFGGCAMERPMGDAVLARHPFLDAVFAGYGEVSLPAYVEALPARRDEPIEDSGAASLDDLPVPSFDEYVAALRQTELDARIPSKIMIETSRGCWYGEKQHCTFCGINGLEMRFRQKSADRVFDEIRSLSRYGLPLSAADNILPLDYFKTLFPRLERESVRFEAFYEIKANCDRRELETLARVGIRRLQPGIESFSTSILKLMRKGVSGIQNVWFLRASEELGIRCQWNLLWGFPGEDPGEYEKMADLFPKMVHLQPPLGSGMIHLLRYSPNEFQAEALGFRDVAPYPSYAYAFGPHERLADQAYRFDYTHADGRDPRTYTRRLESEVARWIELRPQPLAPRCEVFVAGGERVLVDGRRRGTVGRRVPRVVRLDADAWALVQALESPIRPAKLAAEWTRKAPLAPLLDRFLAEGWAVEGDDRIVRLVVVRKDPSPGGEVMRVLKSKTYQLRRALRYWYGVDLPKPLRVEPP